MKKCLYSRSLSRILMTRFAKLFSDLPYFDLFVDPFELKIIWLDIIKDARLPTIL